MLVKEVPLIAILIFDINNYFNTEIIIIQKRLRLRGITIGRHFHANMKVQTAACKDNNKSNSRAATCVKFEINRK